MLFSYCIILSLVLFLSQSEINTRLLSHKLTNSATVLSSIIQRINGITAKLRNPEPRGEVRKEVNFCIVLMNDAWSTADRRDVFPNKSFAIEWRFLQRIKANRSWGKGSGFCGFDIHLMTGFLVKLSYQILSGELAPANTARGPYPKSFGLATICASWHLHGCGWFIICRHDIRIINSDMVLLARPCQHLMCGSNSYNIYCYLKVW